MKFSEILKYFLIWQLAIIIITYLSIQILPLRQTFKGGEDQSTPLNPQPFLKNPLLYSRANFDGIHYISIARRGYGYGQQAFFPLYPKLLSLLNSIFKNFTVTGILISSISFLFGVYLFSKLISLDHPGPVRKWTLIALFIFPVSFFFTSVYTEGLFFFLVIGSFYSARRSRWWLAGIFGFLAAYTRLAGIFFLPALIAEWWLQKKSFKALIPLILIPLGLLLYMSFLQRTTGDSLAFIHVQKLFGQGRSDKIILLYQVFWRYLKMIFTVNRADPLFLTILLEFITGLTFGIISIYSLFKQRLSYSVFNLLSFIIPTLTGTFTSLPRYVLVCFPAFIILGTWLHQTSKLNRLVYFSISCLGFILFLALFSRGYWVS
ncbi:MAG: hypothetical protein G01um101416_101 [Microgenomates group bacterium Gr01-1014_16]|nr:MAG: hypothetical protein G01um101416_101 [Microgenomates group bacterium Gr01-1014_16]